MKLYEKALFQLAGKKVISLKEARALKALFGRGEMDALQLSEESGIPATDIGEVVEGLQKRGLLRRCEGQLKTTPTDCLNKLIEAAEGRPGAEEETRLENREARQAAARDSGGIPRAATPKATPPAAPETALAEAR